MLFTPVPPQPFTPPHTTDTPTQQTHSHTHPDTNPFPHHRWQAPTHRHTKAARQHPTRNSLKHHPELSCSWGTSHSPRPDGRRVHQHTHKQPLAGNSRRLLLLQHPNGGDGRREQQGGARSQGCGGGRNTQAAQMGGGEVGGVQRGGWVVGGAAFRPALSGKDSLTHAHALSLSCGTMGKKAYRPMPTSLLPKCTQCDVLLQRRQGCSAVRMCWPRGALLREGLVVLSTGTVYCVCSVGHIDFEQYHPTKARVAHYAGKLRLCLFHQMRQNPAAGCVERTHRITKYHRMAECESVRQRSHAAHTSSSTNGASDRHTVNRQS